MHIHFIQHVSFEYPGSLLDWANENNHAISITKIFEEALFPPTDLFDVLIIMGGPMAVYDEQNAAWLREEKNFIKTAITKKKKVLGICLGSQLVAETLGAKVYKHSQNEIGWFDIKKEENHFITDKLPLNFSAFHWHGDTFDLPEGAVQLFSSKVCSQQGFIYNNHVMAFQFHPEINNELLQSMIEHEKHELIKSNYVQTEEEIYKSAAQNLSLQKEIIFSIMDAFVSL